MSLATHLPLGHGLGSAYLPQAAGAGGQPLKLCSQTKGDLERVWHVLELRFFICGMGRPGIP